MAFVINCECGYTVRGETEDDVLREAHSHMKDAHPDMVGQVTEQLLSMASES